MRVESSDNVAFSKEGRTDSKASRVGPLDVQPPRIPACHWYLLLPLALFCVTGYMYMTAERAAERTSALSEALDTQIVLASHVAKHSANTLTGDKAPFVELRKLAARVPDELHATKQVLKSATGTHGGTVDAIVEGLETEWRVTEQHVDKLNGLEAPLSALQADAERLHRTAAALLVKSDMLVDAMVAAKAEPAQLRAAERQLLLIQRIETNVRRVLEGGDSVLAAADRFGRDVVLFGDVNAGLKNGSETLGLDRITKPSVRTQLESVADEYRQLAAITQNLMHNATASAELKTTSREIARSTQGITQHAQAAKRVYAERGGPGLEVIRWLAVATLLSLILVGIIMARNTRVARIKAREHSSYLAEEVERRRGALENREEHIDTEIRQMMTDLERLAEMDWARELPPVLVSQDAQVSWAMHGAIDNVRRRVQAVSDKAVDIRSAVLTLRDSAVDLRSSSQRQAEQFDDAAESASKMSASFKSLSNDASRHTEISRTCLSHLKDVTGCVTDSAGSLDAVVESVKQTSNCVRSLADSSQQVRELKDFVEDLSEQSKMLSLNVAIQASMDSEVGQALAEYSDDVQRLAERAKFATRRIERVNESVQEQLDEALTAIKHALWKAGLAADRMRGTRRKLPEIRDDAALLDQLNQGLADVYREHTLHMSEVVKQMSDAARHSSDVRRGLRKTVRAAADLADLTTMLEKSNATTRLPERDTVVDIQAERAVEDAKSDAAKSDPDVRVYGTSA